MNWIFVGILLGSTVTSTHDNKEACLGRQAVLREKGVIGECRAPNTNITGFTATGSTGLIINSPTSSYPVPSRP